MSAKEVVDNYGEDSADHVVGDCLESLAGILFNQTLRISLSSNPDLRYPSFGKTSHRINCPRAGLMCLAALSQWPFLAFERRFSAVARSRPSGKAITPAWAVRERFGVFEEHYRHSAVVAMASVTESPAHFLSEDARRELAAQALEFSLTVVLQLQNPAAHFLDNLGFEKLSHLKSLVQASPSSIADAGTGLRVRGNLPAGTLLTLFPVHGIGMENVYGPDESLLIKSEDDSAYFDSVEGKSPYRTYLPGALGVDSLGVNLPARGLFFLSQEVFSPETPLFIDVNPNRRHTPGWLGSLVNDGAVCTAPDEAAIISYYETSMARKNCVLVPFGPAPLMAYVTTRDVLDGEELLTTYGGEFWLAGLRSEQMEVTERVRSLVREAGISVVNFSSLVARKYAKDTALLNAYFSQRSKLLLEDIKSNADQSVQYSSLDQQVASVWMGILEGVSQN